MYPLFSFLLPSRPSHDLSLFSCRVNDCASRCRGDVLVSVPGVDPVEDVVEELSVRAVYVV